MTSTQVREKLVETIQLDLVGPQNDHAFAHELLPQSPQRWYLTGYLVPQKAPEDQRRTNDDEAVDEAATGSSGDDNDAPEQQAQASYLPSSMGMSVLVGPATNTIKATLRWGDYVGEVEGENKEELDEEEVDRQFEEDLAKADIEPGKEQKPVQPELPEGQSNEAKRPRRGYRREPREETLPIEITEDNGTQELAVPNSRGLRIVASWRSLPHLENSGVAKGTKTLSVFALNDRTVAGERLTFHEIAFQAELELKCEEGFFGRPDLRGIAFPDNADSDEKIADLHYRDVLEFAVGHGVSVFAEEQKDGSCGTVRTTWIPSAEVPRVDHADKETIGEVELAMDRLGNVEDAADAKNCLGGLVKSYRDWIGLQEKKLAAASISDSQRETGSDLVIGAKMAADRIESGIALLADPVCLEAFRIANRSMDRSARQRFSIQQGKAPHEVESPRWRAFQLAFILMNLKGIFDPGDASRRTVDLLFFPTGGGKTEAYLGLAAFTLVLRRMKNPGISSAGVTIIMRYTLRLLTLDQLGRAAALMCALELERKDNKSLGDWPFEIGLWVGSAATPNRMGRANDDGPGKDDTAYAKLIR